MFSFSIFFKIITAISALEEKKITPETTFFCTDSFPFGNRVYHCWKKGGHGRLNLYEAIEQSCDIYFYNVGRLVGINGLARYAGLFGLGKPTGFVFKGEKAGLIPTKEWKKKIKKYSPLTFLLLFGTLLNPALVLQSF